MDTMVTKEAELADIRTRLRTRVDEFGLVLNRLRGVSDRLLTRPMETEKLTENVQIPQEIIGSLHYYLNELQFAINVFTKEVAFLETLA